MSEMIELVAKAMWEQRRAWAANAGIFLEFWGDGTIPKANGIMEEARAAIEALQEPTEAMDAAARAECFRMAGCLDPVMHIWDVMIDEALR